MSEEPTMETDDDRPWEQPGEFRRDCEPHRGPYWMWLSRASRILSLFGPCFPPLMLLCPVVAVVALVMMRGDETEMRRGRMDPAGRLLLEAARRDAWIAFWMTFFWVGFLSVWFFLGFQLIYP